MHKQPEAEHVYNKAWRAPSGHVTCVQETVTGQTVWVARDDDGVVAISTSREDIDLHLTAHAQQEPD